MFSKLIPAVLIFLFVAFSIFHAAKAAINNDHRRQQISNKAAANILAYGEVVRTLFHIPRENYRPITDCMFVTSENGPFSYISQSDNDVVCGVYFLTDPDRVVEIHFHSFDIPCDYNGLVSVIDGWELNGEVFPSEIDHPLTTKERVSEFCGRSRWYKKIFRSSQNAAILQYRVPMRGKGFIISAKYPKNPRPCNALSVSTTEAFTLRNYGRRNNCTLTAVYPGIVNVVAFDVGGGNTQDVVHITETGTSHKCDVESPRDQVQIGGSHGLDTTKFNVIDSICGIDSKSDIKKLVNYDVTSVRLISSGYHDNSVTVSINPITDDDLLDSSSSF